MARDSNVHLVSITSGGTTLGAAASALSLGSTAQFNIPNFNCSTSGATNNTMFSYAGKLVWDATRKIMHQVGTAHTGGVPTSGAGGWINYSENTHTFGRTMYTWAAVGVMGHQYYGTTVNPNNGMLYHSVSSFTGGIWQKPDGSTVWSTGFIADQNPGNTGQWSYGCEWFQEANSGAGGLCVRDYEKWWISDPAVSSWTTFAPTASIGANGDYWSVHVSGFVHVGVGTTHFRCSPTGTHASRASTPIDCGTSNRQTGLMCAHPDGTNMLLFETAGAKRVWKYTQSSNSFAQIGTHAFPTSGLASSTMCIGAVPQHNIVMAWIDTSANGTGVSYIYKVPS